MKKQEKQALKEAILSSLSAGNSASIAEIASALYYDAVQRATNELCKEGRLTRRRVGGYNGSNQYRLETEQQ